MARHANLAGADLNASDSELDEAVARLSRGIAKSLR
jgi:hypothetical protein